MCKQNRSLRTCSGGGSPSDDLEDNAATLRALGFEVEVHDVGEEGNGPLGIYRGAEMQGTKRFLTARAKSSRAASPSTYRKVGH